MPVIFFIAALLCFAQIGYCDSYPMILRGKVTMEDGSPPPFIVGIERLCSDNAGSAPGPLTNKKGEYTWRLDIDPLATRACYLHATHAGYTSNSIEIQGLDTTRTTATLPPIVILTTVADANAIIVSDSNVPFKARSSFSAAMKALDVPDFPEAARQFAAAVKASPKFAQGWHGLGVIQERLTKPAEARQSYEHAIESDSKLLPPYVTLTRLCLKTKDWDCASKTVDAMIKVDSKHLYPEIYLHRAVARYELKDLDGALSNVQEAIRMDPKSKRPRAEYVLGRILEAKGDGPGAREHMTKYLQLEPAPADVDLVKAHLNDVGKPQPSSIEPDLEVL